MSRTFAVEDPATLEVLARVADQEEVDVVRAVDAAQAASPAWSAAAPRERSDVLAGAHALMLRDLEPLAELISAENGKALDDARAEVRYAAEFFRWYAEEAVRPGGEYGEAPAGGARNLVTHRPVGVAALITPWNFPAAMATRKIAPALAAGCTAVLKPAAETPLTALRVAELLAEAGLPAGVLEVVTALEPAGVVRALLADPRVRKVSFTGSTRVGRILLSQAADRVLNASMELGGNAPFVVTADADVAAAVEGAMLAKFRGGGQACTAANRFYVHDDVHDEFLARFCARVEKLRVGRWQDGAEVGPLISAAAVARVETAVEGALDRGGRRAALAGKPSLPGYFVEPVVLADIAGDDPLLAEELFAPVAPVVRWTDEAALPGQVNATEYGLAGYVFAGDTGRAIRLAEQLDVGMVGVNRGTVSDPSAPFGGVKLSGLGREGARNGLRAFTEPQYLSVAWPPP